MVTGLVGDRTLTVLYDSDCGICTATARALVRLDSRHLLRFEPLSSSQVKGAPSRATLAEALHAVDESGRWSSGARASVEIARRVPALRVVAMVARLPGAMLVFDLGYRLVAANRQWLSRRLGLKACQLPAALFGGSAR